MDKQAEAAQKAAEYQKWITRIAEYDKSFQPWECRAQKINDRYRDNRKSSDSGSRFNILWSNVQTLVPAVYSRLPQPDVSRRFRDTDPVGRVASLIIERSLEFEISHYNDYRDAMELCVSDRFLGGRGTAWVRYEPHFIAAQQGLPEDGAQITDDVEADSPEGIEAEQQTGEELEYECAPVDYVHWRDFGHVLSKTWDEVPAIWRKVYMTREALIDRFGDAGEKIPLDERNKDDSSSGEKNTEREETALIYEIWDKDNKQALWLSKSPEQIIEKLDDPLGLDGFWPCPRPLYATITSDSLIPTPDFTLYQDQSNQLDELSNRVEGLIHALRVRGVYDQSITELRTLFANSGNNDLVPVKNWNQFSEKAGLKGSIDIVDLQPIVAALAECYNSMVALKQQIFEIAGIPDIMRGSSEASETATAQGIKANFGSLRLKAMQGRVCDYATELLKIKAQIICKFFQPDTLIQISGADQFSEDDKQYIPQAIELLKNGNARDFRIAISSDSMVQLDERQDKADRVEFLKSVGGFMQQALAAAKETPELAPLLLQLLKFGVRGFKVGKTIEGAFDNALDKLAEEAKNPQPKPNPEADKAQIMAQAKAQEMQGKMQAEMQLEQMRMQFRKQELAQEQQIAERQAQLSAELEKHKQEMQAAENKHQQQLEAEREAQRAQNEMMLEQMRLEREGMEAQRSREFDLLIARLDTATKIEVAQIGKIPDRHTEEESAAASPTQYIQGE